MKNKYLKLFVYGTLKSTKDNFSILKKTLYLEENQTKPLLVKTKEKFPMYVEDSYSFQFPYLEYKKGIGKEIIGELWYIDKNRLDILKEYEGDLFILKQLIVINENNEEIECFSFFKNGGELTEYDFVNLISEF